ncbi:reticulon-like protein B2 [Cinnamomum micranthum f. kanehirae]|uniref:Reticulon-like protein n=1 Tax=Cinnamomum micranthum f. kanehirae TaxID=337451 RepID=A0A3S3N529_9MAGN|nr:reticulon-like protein B2 [Cinnamomum micranthum f. kanehirae]
MPSLIDSDSEDHASSSKTKTKLFGRERDLHSIFGGGKVADIILWKNKHLSGAILAAATVVWFMFEVVEYNFLTLLCYISITTMLAIFIWCNAAPLLNRPAPKIPEVILSESHFKEVALAFHRKLHVFITILYDIARGEDLKHFLLAIGSLWILSVVGSSFSTISLLYSVFLCIQILPLMYERYEDEVEYTVKKGKRNLKKLYKHVDSNVLGKIPRAEVKDKKSK